MSSMIWIKRLSFGLILFALGGAFFLGAAIAALLLAALSLLLVLWLLQRTANSILHEPPTETQRATGRRRKELEREKQDLLKAIKEIQFDHEMHKLSDEDFHALTATYRGRALRVMRQLDESGDDYRQLIEADLAALRDSQ